MPITHPRDVLRTPVDVFSTPKRHEGVVAEGRPDPSYRAFELLYAAMAATPFIAGLGKIAGAMVLWEGYVHPSLVRGLGENLTPFIRTLGVAEVALALGVALMPRWGGYAVAAWLGLGIANFLLTPGHFGIALACAALAAAAVALSWLAKDFGRP